MAYVIYDIYDGLKFEELDTENAFRLLEELKEKFGENFYFRVFCQDFDYIFDKGIEYKDETNAQANGCVYILGGKYKVSCQFKEFPRYIEVIHNG
jgi:hypothetical protein